jgi:hypothetical protein
MLHHLFECPDVKQDTLWSHTLTHQYCSLSCSTLATGLFITYTLTLLNFLISHNWQGKVSETIQIISVWRLLSNPFSESIRSSAAQEIYFGGNQVKPFK